MMKKIKTFKTFESNYIQDLFKDSHSALDLSKLIPIKKVINKKGPPTQQDLNDIIDFVNLDPNFIYYDPNNSLYPYIYWKDFIYLEFFGTLSLEAAKMMMLDKRLNYQQQFFYTPTAAKRNRFVMGSIHDLPFERGSIDCIVAPLAVEASSHKNQLIDELDRVLSPMGH